jgi:hypothetical protein
MTLVSRLVASLSCLACLSVPASAFAGKPCLSRSTAVRSIAEAEALAARAAQVYRLSPIPLKCVVYQSVGDSAHVEAGSYWIVFRENHTPECGGAPQTGPRLFTIKITAGGRMETDAYGTDTANGTYRPLKCLRGKSLKTAPH